MRTLKARLQRSVGRCIASDVALRSRAFTSKNPEPDNTQRLQRHATGSGRPPSVSDISIRLIAAVTRSVTCRGLYRQTPLRHGASLATCAQKVHTRHTPAFGLSRRGRADIRAQAIDRATRVGVLLLVFAGVVALWSDVTVIWRVVMALIVVAVAGVRLVRSRICSGPLGRRSARRSHRRSGGYPGVRAPRHRRRAGAARRRPGPVAARAPRPRRDDRLRVARISLEPFWTDHELPTRGPRRLRDRRCSSSCPAW